VGDARPLKISKDRQKIKHLKLQQFKSKPSPSSLFEELFPDDTKKKKVVTLPKERQALDWAALSPWKPLHRETKDVFSPTGTGLQYDPTTPEYHKMRERRDASVLVLSNASKNLVESDFLRLSPKGEHIEGWSSGIIKGNELSCPVKFWSAVLTAQSHSWPRSSNPRVSRSLFYPLLDTCCRSRLPRYTVAFTQTFLRKHSEIYDF
jgi:hypothetical protein